MKVKILAALLITGALGMSFSYKSQEKNMLELKYDLGENIAETAKKSGAPAYSVEDVAGLISYQLSSVPADIAIRFTRPGYEIRVRSVFSLVLYADNERRNNLAVQALMLQFSTDSVNSHKDGENFVMQLAHQFKNSRWKRHIGENCPAVSGRSAYLNEAEQPGVFGSCPLDPNHVIPLDDWIKLTQKTQTFQWLGNGIIATLSFRHSDDARGIAYSINLDFEDYIIKKNASEEHMKKELEAGDEKGWESTFHNKKVIAENKIKIKIIESNALRRGDHLVPR